MGVSVTMGLVSTNRHIKNLGVDQVTSVPAKVLCLFHYETGKKEKRKKVLDSYTVVFTQAE